MKISKETLEAFSISYPLENLAPIERILFIDIETTGLVANSSNLYMIGCAYYEADKWHTIQWFSENPEEEDELLIAFFEFALNYDLIMHFNGNTFDLPYLLQKCESFDYPYSFQGFQGIDVYRRIAPYKDLLKLEDCKQHTLEKFLGIKRSDSLSGKELISIYNDYVKDPNEDSEKLFFSHNAECLRGLLGILPILAYYDLFNAEEITARKVQANSYKDATGNKRKELAITVVLPSALPKPLELSANRCTFNSESEEATIKIPIYEEELKFFYKNYQDYYYLPDEDMALHKSVSGYVDTDHRVQATAQNCYARKLSSYLPQWEALFTPLYRREYKGQKMFFELTDELKRDRQAFSVYAKHLIHMLSISE